MKLFALAILCTAFALSARATAAAPRRTTRAAETQRSAQTPRHTLTPRPAAPSIRFDAGTSALDVPFVLSHNLVLIRTRVNRAAPLWFILDTGAEATVIDSGAARRLGLRSRGAVVGNGAAGTASGSVLEAATVRLGGVEARDLTLYALPLDSLAPSFGRRIGGIVGNDIIGRLVVEIDYARRVVNFHDPSSYEYRGAGVRLPVTLEGGLIFARGEVEPKDGGPLACKFEIDTGSTSAVLLNTPFVAEHDLLSSVPAARRIKIGGVGGTGAAVLARLRAVRLADFALDSPVARLSQATKGDYASAKYDALMGGEIFRRFKLVVDITRRRLVFEPNAALLEPFEDDMSGIELLADGRDLATYLVDDVDEGSAAYEAGVRGGDVLASIDGRPARAYTLDEIRAMFREDGREYSLTLRRGRQLVRARMKLRRLV